MEKEPRGGSSTTRGKADAQITLCHRRRREALVYEPRNDGTLKLVALEYVIFQSDWKGAGAPSLFGEPFDFVPDGNRYGLPAFYALHAWIWKPNPRGLFFAWNPRVDCS